MSRLQGGGRLGDDVEGLVGAQRAIALEDRRQRLAGHELHHQIRGAVLLAVVEHAGDALVVDQGGVAGLGAEALQEARVPHVLVLEDLDRDGPPDDVIRRLPHLAHAADRDPRLQLVATTERHTLRRPHLPSTASMTFFAIGAAMLLPEPDFPNPPPSSTTTATATLGFSAGAKPVNHRVWGLSPFSAVPVFPATSIPSILAPVAAPERTPSASTAVSARA